MALSASAATLPVSFQLAPAASAVALQFDVASSVAGSTLTTPVLQGASGHVVDAQAQAGGATRFIVYSSANAPLSPSGAVSVTLDLLTASPQDGILTVSNVVASDSNGLSVAAVPGALPVITSFSPSAMATAAVGRNVPVGVEVVDLDGTVVGVTFLLNGTPAASDASRPFGGAVTSATSGDQTLTVQAQDSQGKTALSGPVTLRFIDPASLSSYAAFQSAWLGGAGAFNADATNTGIKNGLAWALGIDPLNPDRSRLPTQQTEQIGPDRFFVYRARILATGVVHQILGSSTLTGGSWTPLPAQQITETLEAGGWRLIEARVPVTPGGQRQFVQLQVQQP